MPQSWRFCLPFYLLALAACSSVGGQRLDVDHRDYMQAVATAEKEQTLMNIVRLRYADVPNFLQITQVISGYTLQGSLQAGLNAYPSSMTGNFATLLGQTQFEDHPTFTFAPVTAQVPASDTQDGDTVPAIHDAVERRPIAVVHAGPKPPSDNYASIEYNGRAFWIGQNDFDSKVAFTTIEILRALAASGTSAAGTIVTIPTR